MPAALDPHFAGLHHLLVVDGATTPEDVATLARSRYPDAAWLTPEELVLREQVVLTGPWPLTPTLQQMFDLPSWAVHAWVCLMPHERGGTLPLALAGTDPLLDAYPQAIPAGSELEVLRFLHAAARRVGGGLHLAGTGVTLVGDPQDAVDLTVYGPIDVDANLILAAGGPDAAVDGALRRNWSVSMPALPEHPDSGIIQVTSERAEVPFALSGMDWAGTAYATSIRWHPAVPLSGRLTPAERELRAAVIERVENIARTASALSGGVAVDDDGFVVAL